MKRYLLTFCLCAIFSICIQSQHTVGLLSYDPMKTYDGYNLMYPHNQPNVFLLNNCGQIVHQWDDEDNFRTGNIAYLRPDGSLVKAKRDIMVSDDAIWAGGGGEFIEILDWDNNLIWEYALNNDSLRLHHDIAPLANGNIIAVAWERKTLEQSIQAGRNPATMAQDEVWSEYIFEINPNTNTIEWEWHLWDHLIQDFDSTKANYGVVEDHPELIDINYDENNGHPDWLHINAIDYNELRSQILISVPYFNEVWILDHTTTTQQAAGHNGGFSGAGGDLIYRWGNPKTYTRDTTNEQKLFFQHDAQFVDDFIIGSNPHYNSIAVFNNQAGPDFSTADFFRPEWDMYTSRYAFDGSLGQPYFPQDFSLTLTHPIPQMMYSTGLSSIQLLPNGNYFIAVGRFGYCFEMTPNNEITWEYKVPLAGGFPVAQGTELAVNQNLTFRMKRYPTDYSAFIDKDLTSKGYIELEPDETFCDKILDVEILENTYSLKVYPNPAQSHLVLEWEAGMYTHLDIYSVIGQKMTSIMRTGGREFLDVSEWDNGVYYIQLEGVKVARFVVSH